VALESLTTMFPRRCNACAVTPSWTSKATAMNRD
jgi:hypothetical protein